MSAYTKGPWRKMVSGDGFISIGNDKSINLGAVLGFKDTIADVWKDDDADLIAAAPDLLEALKMMVATGAPVGTFGDVAYEKSVAAIAKAEGK